MLVKFNIYANANTFVKVDGHDWLQTFKYKTRELWGLFAEVRKKNLSWDFEVIYIFRKIAVLNICRYLRGFYTYKNINNIFLRIPKLTEIGWIVPSEKRQSKTYATRI